ncbi:MAG: prepilin peptidase [Phycisphaerae bacterium]
MLVLVAVGGALIGSFLNVIIFRLPRGLSISYPRWSFCPHCQHRIRPYHNLPVIGWLWLRGRCRDCEAPISVVYPIVECATSLLFVMVWDALFAARMLPGIEQPAIDWPIAVALLVLFSGLLATSVMDIESYTIDIRLSFFTMVVGVICHAIRGMPAGPVASDVGRVGAEKMSGMLPASLCLIGVAMGAAWWLTAFVATRLMKSGDPEHASLPPSHEDSSETEPDATAYTQTAGQRFRPWPVILFGGFVIGMVFWQHFAAGRGAGDWVEGGAQRGGLASIVFMTLLILASVIKRESDVQIIHELEAERDQARRIALHEFGWLLPSILVGAGLFVYFRMSGKMTADFPALIGFSAPAGGWADHLYGGCQAVAGMIFAAALGWAVRILGTLAFAKEAYGTGDIYIMAAIGAVAGIWAVTFTFFLASLLALLGVAITIFWKSSRAIPFGPWLALGAFVNLWLFKSLLGTFWNAGSMLWMIVSGQPLWFSEH